MNMDSNKAASVGARAAIPPEFWPAMGKACAAREWPTLPVLDFPLSVVNVKFYPNSWLCCMIDGHQKSVDGAMSELHAATHPLGYPAYRLLVAVYQTVTKAERDALLVKHLGDRFHTPQVVVAVIHHQSGQFFGPNWPSTGQGPEYNPEVGSVLEAALREALGPHQS